MSTKDLHFQSRVFYIRASEERTDLGEILSFESEIEADIDLNGHEAAQKSGGAGRFFRSQQFYLEVGLYFKNATKDEIANQDNI